MNTVDTFHLISIAIFFGILPVILMASMVLKYDLILRRVILLGLLGETLLGVLIEIPLASLVTVGMFLHQFMRYVRLLDERIDFQNRLRGTDLPWWARNAPDPEAILEKLGQAGRHVGGSSLGTKKIVRRVPDQPGVGRHRMQMARSW